MTHDSYTTLAVEIAEAVATLRLNRPDRLNALDATMIDELVAAFGRLETDSRVRAIVLTGAGERAFCAGADISGFSGLANALAGAEAVRRGQRLTLLLEGMRTPVVAAINGFALGGGLELAMATDIRIASERAKFGQPEVNLGLMPGFGGTQRTARLLGRGAAMLLCLSAEQIDAAEALRLGLVQRVVAHDQVYGEALRVAAVIASKAPLAVAATKRAIDDGLAQPSIRTALEHEALLFGALVETADFREGVSAFLEKRPPKFTGE